MRLKINLVDVRTKNQENSEIGKRSVKRKKLRQVIMI